jgi:hypothetical protein
MGDSKLFDAAKKTTEIVAAKASEVTRSVAGDTIRDMAAGVKEQLADVTTDIKEMSAAKLDEALGDLNAALPILRDAGYVLDGVTVKLGLAPQIVANFAGGAVVPEERVDALLAEHSGRKLTTLLVKAVRHATTLQSKLTISGMRADGLSLEVGLVPQVTVKFSPLARTTEEERPD